MYTGRKSDSAASIEAVAATIPYNGIIKKWNTVDGYTIKEGVELDILHEPDPLYDDQYGIFEIDSSDNLLLLIADYTSSSIVNWTAASTGVAGIAIVNTYHNPSGYFEINCSAVIKNIVVADPVEAIRHIKHLQNWSELGSTGDWGKERISDAKIKIVGGDSFADTNLTDIRSLSVARQVLDVNGAWTDTLVQSLCEEFFLLSYQDADGNECITDPFEKITPTDTVTLSEIMGKVGEVKYPSPERVYCMPVVNYAYDYATEKYTKRISVDGVWNSTWQASYTPGMSAYDGELTWYNLRQLYLKYGVVEPMPNNLTNKHWVADYDTAVWALNRQVFAMDLLRLSFSIAYSVARSWDIGKHFMINFPHETNGSNIEVVVEKITKRKNSGSVYLEVVLLDEIPSNFYTSDHTWQDTVDNTVDTLLQKTYTYYADRLSGVTDRQDTREN